MRLVTKDLKSLGCGSGKCSDSRRITISHFCSLMLFAL